MQAELVGNEKRVELIIFIESTFIGVPRNISKVLKNTFKTVLFCKGCLCNNTFTALPNSKKNPVLSDPAVRKKDTQLFLYI